jgi:tyrosinase
MPSQLSRRHLLTAAATGLVAAPLLGAARAPARTEDGDHPYRGRIISIGSSDGHGGGPGHPPTRSAPPVSIDGDDLHMMVNGDGTYTSIQVHHQAFATVLGAARAAVDDLRGARLVPLPRPVPGYDDDRGGAAPSPGPVYQRVAHTALGPARKRAFVAAVLELKRAKVYDRFVRTHLEFSRDSNRVAHSAPSFLPWHRRFLLDFETELRRVDPSVTLPYWDWTAGASSLWSADFLGGDGRDSDDRVTTGPFTGDRWPLVAGTDRRPYLRRTLGRGETRRLPSRTEQQRVLAQRVYDAAPWNGSSRRGLRNQLEGWRGPGMHNQVHNWVGGTMLNGGSPNDPVFWLHHCNVDRLWARWQADHPDGGYLPASGADKPLRPWGDDTPRDLLAYQRHYTYV